MNDSQKFYLDSINILLQSINELSISDDTELVEIIEAQRAANVLEEVKKSVLSQGWDFNTDEDWEMVPDVDGYISIPANILDISTNDSDVIMRDWRLYSKKNKSAIFEESVKCHIVWDMDFNSLTHPLRHYITIRASRIFQYRTIGDLEHYKFSEDDEHHAYISARRSDGRTANYNMLESEFGQMTMAGMD